MPVPARLSIVTLGVSDLARSVAFYQALGWSLAERMDEIAWFRTADSHLGIYLLEALAADAGLAGRVAAPGAFGGITLAINVGSEAEVAPALAEAVAAGATLLKPATRADWGGVSGYFADPDGYPWEIAFAPGFPVDPDGRIHIG